MKKFVILLIMLISVLFTAGCSENSKNATNSITQVDNNVVAITQLEQINKSLEKTPVFVKIGARWCPECRSLKPVLDELAVEYQGKATIGAVDVDKSPEIGRYFGVEIIPYSFVVTGIENGKYIYMQKDGNVSTDISQARFVGRNETDEEMFKKVLNNSLLQQKKKSSNETKQ